MLKSKYRFNPESLTYKRIENSFQERLKKVLFFIIGIVVTVIIFYPLITLFFDTPEERGLKRENSQLMLQYEIMNGKLAELTSTLNQMQQRDDNIYRTIFGAEPIDKAYREAGTGGINKYSELEGLEDAEVVIQTAQKLDKLYNQIEIQRKSYDTIVKLAKTKEQMLKSIPAIQPISNIDLTRTASGWGYRIHPIYKIRKFHYGMDFTAPTGTEIYATGDGIVEVVKSSRGYGNHVVIRHGFGYKSLYAHMNGFNVKKGQKVKRGDVIGYVGNTGQSTAPHLHYEVSLNGERKDPIHFYFNDLSPEEFHKMIEISSRSGKTFD